MLGLLDAATCVAGVARSFVCTCNERTIYRPDARFQQSGSEKDKAPSVKPRIRTPFEVTFIVMSSQPTGNRFMAAPKLV